MYQYIFSHLLLPYYLLCHTPSMLPSSLPCSLPQYTSPPSPLFLVSLLNMSASSPASFQYVLPPSLPPLNMSSLLPCLLSMCPPSFPASSLPPPLPPLNMSSLLLCLLSICPPSSPPSSQYVLPPPLPLSICPPSSPPSAHYVFLPPLPPLSTHPTHTSFFNTLLLLVSFPDPQESVRYRHRREEGLVNTVHPDSTHPRLTGFHLSYNYPFEVAFGSVMSKAKYLWSEV